MPSSCSVRPRRHFESYYNCKHGKYTLLELPERVDDQKMPHVRVVDMRQAASHQRGKEGIPIFSPQLKEAITQRLERKEQTILFLNRRGYSTSLQMPKCGEVVQCRIAASRSRFTGRNKAPLPHLRPCRARAIRLPEREMQKSRDSLAGTGNAAGRGNARQTFPHARIKRMDADTMKRKTITGRCSGDFRTARPTSSSARK